MFPVTSPITEIVDGKGFYSFTPFADTGLLEREQITECEVVLVDQRQLSPKQRNHIFALVSDISDYAAGIRLDRRHRQSWRDEMLRSLQLDYLIDVCDSEEVRKKLTYNYCQLRGIDLFSLAERTPATIDMSTARDFIDWLIELCVVNGVPCSESLLNRCEDIRRYLYACILHHTCAICGRKADLHEVDHVGMGRNRREISHAGQRAQPLCRLHHQEAHDWGQQTFDTFYHLECIELTEELCKELGWKK